MGLFKYCTADRIDVLETSLIRFTPANASDDPFECLPDSRLIEHPAWQRQNESDVVAELMVDDAVRSVLEGRGMRLTPETIRRAHSESYRRRLPDIRQLALSELSRGREPFRILCFSRVLPSAPEAMLLWGHYTGDHQGIVIEFDANNDWVVGHAGSQGHHRDLGIVSRQMLAAGGLYFGQKIKKEEVTISTALPEGRVDLGPTNIIEGNRTAPK